MKYKDHTLGQGCSVDHKPFLHVQQTQHNDNSFMNTSQKLH